MDMPLKVGLWVGALAAALVAGFYVVVLLRKWFLADVEKEQADNADSISTTAQVESMKAQGLIDDKQYEKLIEEVRRASRRRAERAKKRPSPSNKTSLFG